LKCLSLNCRSPSITHTHLEKLTMATVSSSLDPKCFEKAGIRKVGDENSMVPDFPSGLMNMYEKIPNESGIGYYTMFDHEILLVSDPDVIEEVLDTNVEHYLWGGIKPASIAFFGPKVLFVLEGKEWQDLRRVMRPPLMRSNVHELAADVVNVATILADKVHEQYAKSRNRLMNVVEMAQLYHLQAAAQTMMHYNLKAIEEQLGTRDAWSMRRETAALADDSSSSWTQSFDFLLAELARRCFDPDPKVSGDYMTQSADREDNRKWKSAHDTVHGEILPLIRRRLRRRQDIQRNGGKARSRYQQPPNDMLTFLLDAYARESSSDGADFSAEDFDRVLGANVVELLFAGYNTVVNVISTAIFLFVKNPSELRKLRRELDNVLGGRTMTWADFEKLKFTRWSFFETLRLAPPAPAIARKITHPVEANGFTIPVDAEVMLPLCAVHRDPAHWKRADAFDPSRFAKKPRPGTFKPFSGGARSCLGQHYAEVVYTACISTLLQRFDFSCPSDFVFEPIFNGFGWAAGGKRNADSKEAANVVPMHVKERRRPRM